MSFVVDTSNIQDGPVMPGEYEVVINKVTEGESKKNKTPYIQIDLIIRNDVMIQDFKNRHLYYTIYDTKSTREQGIYARQINTVSKYAGVQNGARFANIQEWGKTIEKRPVLANVIEEIYNDNKVTKVNYIAESKYPQCFHDWTKTIQINEQNQEDSLPF